MRLAIGLKNYYPNPEVGFHYTLAWYSRVIQPLCIICRLILEVHNMQANIGTGRVA